MEMNTNIEETRKSYPANVEGSKEFNEVEAIQRTEEQEKSQEEMIKELLSNEKVKADALTNANDIKKKCKGWFTVQQLARKLMLKPEPVFDMLNLLCIFQMAYRKEHKGDIRYKIILSNNEKLTIKEEELREAEATVSKLKSEIRLLCEAVAKEETNN
jgi:hypothetical protein